MPKDMSASIRQRLRALAKTRNEDFEYVLRQYVMQRILFRLGCSDYSEKFVLKGALLFWIWNNEFHRPTRDIDLLGFTSNDIPNLVKVFRQIVSLQYDDGLAFDGDSVKGIEIKEEADYSGVRITGLAYLAKARVPFQIDIGFDDVVIPDAEEVQIPSYLDLPLPTLHVYPVYTVLAEKFQAMVMLGVSNSRMKDFYDINTIAKSMMINGATLSQAVKATFERRKTNVSSEPLTIFTDAFKLDKNKQTQWNAFIKKVNLNVNNSVEVNTFSEVVSAIQIFIEPVYQAIVEQRLFSKQWLCDKFQWS